MVPARTQQGRGPVPAAGVRGTVNSEGRSGEGRLAFSEYGSSGQHVVLLHSLGLDRRAWWPVTAGLEATARVIAYDLPGYGGSSAVRADDIESFADAVAAEMTRHGQARAVVVGMSFGGCVALALAARHPGMVRALVLVDTTAWYGAEARDRWEERARDIRGNGFAPVADAQLERWLSDEFRSAQPGTCSRLRNIFVSNDLDGYVRACRALGAMDLRESARGLAVPTAVLVGSDDGATPVTHAEDLQRRIRGATLRILPGCRHLAGIERADAVAGAVAGFAPAGREPGTGA